MNCPRCRCDRVHPFYALDESQEASRRPQGEDYGVMVPVGICFALFAGATMIAALIEPTLAYFCAGFGALCIAGLAGFMGLQKKLAEEEGGCPEPEEDPEPDHWVCARCGAAFGHAVPATPYSASVETTAASGGSSQSSPSSARAETATGAESEPPGASRASSV